MEVVVGRPRTTVTAHPGCHAACAAGSRYSLAIWWSPAKLALAARKPSTICVGFQPGSGPTAIGCEYSCSWLSPFWAEPTCCTGPFVGTVAHPAATTATATAAAVVRPPVAIGIRFAMARDRPRIEIIGRGCPHAAGPVHLP